MDVDSLPADFLPACSSFSATSRAVRPVGYFSSTERIAVRHPIEVTFTTPLPLVTAVRLACEAFVTRLDDGDGRRRIEESELIVGFQDGL